MAALVTGFATTFWDNAIEAEVYASSCALMAFVVWLALRWQERLDEALGGKAGPDDSEEQAARKEKTAALHELYASRLSVLVGPAGTGKTTLLKVLCGEPQVAEGGILKCGPAAACGRALLWRGGHVGSVTVSGLERQQRRALWQRESCVV